MLRSLYARRSDGVVLQGIYLVLFVWLAACGSVVPQKTDGAAPCVIGTSRIDSCTLK